MRNLFLYTLVLALLGNSTSVAAKINVFACEPEWAALAGEVGGSEVDVSSATSAQQDPHHVRAKPSLIVLLRKADLIICSGASLEIGWLPVLLQSAGSKLTQSGTPGFLLAAEVVPVLDKPLSLDRSQGDIHPEGNPHVHLNPHNIALVAKELASRLEKIDGEHAGYYQTQYEEFTRKWREATRVWEAKALTLKGLSVVAHHSSFAYLFDWVGIEQIATLEPKPGVSPTSSHLEELLRTLSSEKVGVIVRTPYEPGDASDWLAKKTGIPALKLPFTVGGDAKSQDLFSLFDDTLTILQEAAHVQH